VRFKKEGHETVGKQQAMLNHFYGTLGPNTLWQSNVPMENSPFIVYR
jgi:hypothetical protein